MDGCIHNTGNLGLQQCCVCTHPPFPICYISVYKHNKNVKFIQYIIECCILITGGEGVKFDKLSFSVIGGDQRQIKLCNYLTMNEYPVTLFGFSNVAINPLVRQCNNLGEAISSSDIVIGPIPCSQNDKDLFTHYYERKVKVEDVIKRIDSSQIFMAGRLTETIQKMLVEYDVTYIDLLERDDMAIRNAIPTRFRFRVF